MLPSGRPSVVCSKSPNWKGSQAQCHKLKLDFQVGSGRPSPPSPGADSTAPNTIKPAFHLGQLHQVGSPHSPAEKRRPRLSQCLHTDHGAMSKAVAVCSFVLDNTNPTPSRHLFPPSTSSCPVHLPFCTPASLCCALASLLCPQEGPRGHPSHVASPFPFSPPVPTHLGGLAVFWPRLTEE